MGKFAEILDKKLDEIQRSNRWLAGIVSMHPATIGNYRKGTSEPSLTDAARIAKVVGFDLSECYAPEEVKKIKIHEAADKILNERKEGVVEVPLFPTGADLLSALIRNKKGYSIDVSMARERTLVNEGLAHEGVFAAKVDHLFDIDEHYGDILLIGPAENIKKDHVLLITTDPPEKFYIRKIFLIEDKKIILKTAIEDQSSIEIDCPTIIGKLKADIRIWE